MGRLQHGGWDCYHAIQVTKSNVSKDVWSIEKSKRSNSEWRLCVYTVAKTREAGKKFKFHDLSSQMITDVAYSKLAVDYYGNVYHLCVHGSIVHTWSAKEPHYVGHVLFDRQFGETPQRITIAAFSNHTQIDQMMYFGQKHGVVSVYIL